MDRRVSQQCQTQAPRRGASRLARVLPLALLVVPMLSLVACTETMHVRTDEPGATIRIDGGEVQALPARGRAFDVSVLAGDVPYEVYTAQGETYAGVIERDGLSWWLAVPAIGLPLCIAPACIGCGLVTANPAATVGGAAALASGGIASLFAAFSLPTWWTLPCMAASGCGAFAPMSALGLSARTPDYVLVTPEGAEPIDLPTRGGKPAERKPGERKQASEAAERLPQPAPVEKAVHF